MLKIKQYMQQYPNLVFLKHFCCCFFKLWTHTHKKSTGKIYNQNVKKGHLWVSVRLVWYLFYFLGFLEFSNLENLEINEKLFLKEKANLDLTNDDSIPYPTLKYTMLNSYNEIPRISKVKIVKYITNYIMKQDMRSSSRENIIPNLVNLHTGAQGDFITY